MVPPLLPYRGIFEQGTKRAEPKRLQFIEGVMLNPRFGRGEQRCWHGDISIVVDDDFAVRGQTEVKLNPIVEANGMAKALEGVLWRLLPHVPHWLEMEPITFDLLHVFSGPPKHRQHPLAVIIPKTRSEAPQTWTPMES